MSEQSQVTLLRCECYLPSPLTFLCFSEHLETRYLYVGFMWVFQDLNHKLSLYNLMLT